MRPPLGPDVGGEGVLGGGGRTHIAPADSPGLPLASPRCTATLAPAWQEQPGYSAHQVANTPDVPGDSLHCALPPAWQQEFTHPRHNHQGTASGAPRGSLWCTQEAARHSRGVPGGGAGDDESEVEIFFLDGPQRVLPSPTSSHSSSHSFSGSVSFPSHSSPHSEYSPLPFAHSLSASGVPYALSLQWPPGNEVPGDAALGHVLGTPAAYHAAPADHASVARPARTDASPGPLAHHQDAHHQDAHGTPAATPPGPSNPGSARGNAPCASGFGAHHVKRRSWNQGQERRQEQEQGQGQAHGREGASEGVSEVSGYAAWGGASGAPPAHRLAKSLSDPRALQLVPLSGPDAAGTAQPSAAPSLRRGYTQGQAETPPAQHERAPTLAGPRGGAPLSCTSPRGGAPAACTSLGGPAMAVEGSPGAGPQRARTSPGGGAPATCTNPRAPEQRGLPPGRTKPYCTPIMPLREPLDHGGDILAPLGHTGGAPGVYHSGGSTAAVVGTPGSSGLPPSGRRHRRGMSFDGSVAAHQGHAAGPSKPPFPKSPSTPSAHPFPGKQGPSQLLPSAGQGCHGPRTSPRHGAPAGVLASGKALPLEGQNGGVGVGVGAGPADQGRLREADIAAVRGLHLGPWIPPGSSGAGRSMSTGQEAGPSSSGNSGRNTNSKSTSAGNGNSSNGDRTNRHYTSTTTGGKGPMMMKSQSLNAFRGEGLAQAASPAQAPSPKPILVVNKGLRRSQSLGLKVTFHNKVKVLYV